jgi:hypothetical protein
MAWASVASSNDSDFNKASATTWTAQLQANHAVGDVIVLVLATDNVSTTDGNTTLHSGITDSQSNTWTKLHEFTNGQGSAAAGATVSAWVCKVTTALVQSIDVLAVTFSSAVVAKVYISNDFTVSAGSTISVLSPQDLANDALDPGSMAISGLTSGEYLFLRGIASEGLATTGTATTNYTPITPRGSSGGSATTNVSAWAEWRILTGTGDTSNPTVAAVDSASIFLALKAAVSAGPQTVTPSGLASSQAFGAVTISTGPVTKTMTGLASAGSFGTAVPRNIITVSGLASAAVLGAPTAIPGPVTKTMAGLASAQSFGAITVVPGGTTRTMTGLASASTFGTIKGNLRFAVSGLGSAQAFGTPTVHTAVTRTVTGLGSAQAFGTVVAAPGGVTRSVSGLASAAGFGAEQFKLAFSVVGLGSAQAFGVPTVTLGSTGSTVNVSGLASASSFGTVTPRPGGVTTVVTGLGSAQSFGSTRANQVQSVGGLTSAQTFGTITPTVGPVVVLIVGVGSAQAFGGTTTSGGTPPTFNPAVHGGRHTWR